MQHKTIDITALGEILIDFTEQDRNAQGQKLFAQNAGGAPANVLVAAQKLGSTTAFIGKAGNDLHGAFLKRTLEQEHVAVDGFVLDNAFFTTLAFVELAENGERTFAFARKPGADTQLHSEELPLDQIAQSRIFHVGSLSLTDSPSRETTFVAVAHAKQNGAMISYDPNYRASLWSDEQTAIAHMRSMIAHADLMKLSEEECVLLTDFTSPQRAAQALIEQGVSLVVITLGNDGALVCTAEKSLRVEGFTSQVVDTTGAGDAFWGGLLHKIADSRTPLADLQPSKLTDFARYANAVASLCVETLGAIPAMPNEQAVCARLAQ